MSIIIIYRAWMEDANKTAPEMWANYLLDKWKNWDVVVVAAVDNNLASVPQYRGSVYCF